MAAPDASNNGKEKLTGALFLILLPPGAILLGEAQHSRRVGEPHLQAGLSSIVLPAHKQRRSVSMTDQKKRPECRSEWGKIRPRSISGAEQRNGEG